MRKLKPNFPLSPGVHIQALNSQLRYLGSLDNASIKTVQVLHAGELFSLTTGREVQCHNIL